MVTGGFSQNESAGRVKSTDVWSCWPIKIKLFGTQIHAFVSECFHTCKELAMETLMFEMKQVHRVKKAGIINFFDTCGLSRFRRCYIRFQWCTLCCGALSKVTFFKKFQRVDCCFLRSGRRLSTCLVVKTTDEYECH